MLTECIPDLFGFAPVEGQKVEARRRAEGATLKALAESYDIGLATISRLTAQRRPSWR